MYECSHAYIHVAKDDRSMVLELSGPLLFDVRDLNTDEDVEFIRNKIANCIRYMIPGEVQVVFDIDKEMSND